MSSFVAHFFFEKFVLSQYFLRVQAFFAKILKSNMQKKLWRFLNFSLKTWCVNLKARVPTLNEINPGNRRQFLKKKLNSDLKSISRRRFLRLAFEHWKNVHRQKRPRGDEMHLKQLSHWLHLLVTARGAKSSIFNIEYFFTNLFWQKLFILTIKYPSSF